MIDNDHSNLVMILLESRAIFYNLKVMVENTGNIEFQIPIIVFF